MTKSKVNQIVTELWIFEIYNLTAHRLKLFRFVFNLTVFDQIFSGTFSISEPVSEHKHIQKVMVFLITHCRN